MSEVSKRDSQSKLINKYAAFSEKINGTKSIAEIQVMKRELDNAWHRFQILHEEVMGRAGAKGKNEGEANACGWFKEQFNSEVNDRLVVNKKASLSNYGIEHCICGCDLAATASKPKDLSM